LKLPAFLAAQVVQSPARIALVCGTERLSFAELDERSSRLAAALASLGVGVGARVAIYLPNCTEFVLAFIAIVKAGAIAVPIGTRLTAQEIAYILEDSAPRAAFVHPETREAFAQARALAPVPAVIATQGAREGELDLAALSAQHAPRSFDIPASFDDCMIAYTSGTTGRPKGAILTQANYFVPNGYVNAVQWGLVSQDIHLITTPLTHRTAFGRVINMLCLGTPLVILPRFDAAEAARLCSAERITVLGMVPTVGRMLLPAIEAEPEKFATLRIMVATGEAFPREVKERILKALPWVGIHSYFAMTECGALTNLPPADQLAKSASIGRLVPGVEARFIDAEGAEVVRGEVGELWVRSGEPGRFVTMRGYFNKPRETAEAFRDGWMATGDLGRIDEEGYLYIVDRKKDMVLSGGYNIYSREVEIAIAEHPAVNEVAVAGVPDPVYGEAVAAWIVLREGASASADDIVEHCRNRIAGYKKPKYVHLVKELPRTSSGKVLKFRLRETFVEAAKKA
jgi:long-chain acyl-CoA synthetase